MQFVLNQDIFEVFNQYVSLYTVNVLLLSKRSRYTVSPANDIVLSIISLVTNTSFVVDLFLRYAAEFNLELILFIIQTIFF